MRLAKVTEEGFVFLGDQPEYPPGTMVDIIRTCTGTLMIRPHDDDPAAYINAGFKPLVGGAAQKAMRDARHKSR